MLNVARSESAKGLKLPLRQEEQVGFAVILHCTQTNICLFFSTKMGWNMSKTGNLFVGFSESRNLFYGLSKS